MNADVLVLRRLASSRVLSHEEREALLRVVARIEELERNARAEDDTQRLGTVKR